MTPVNLGDLPSAQPIPLGLAQIKLASATQGQIAAGDNVVMQDGTGAPMQISIATGSRPGWWVIRAETIFSIAEAVWNYFAWTVRLSQADANGIQDENAHHRLHSALSWQQSCIDTAYKLNANTTYTATMVFGYRQGGTIYYWAGFTYTYIGGEFIAEGSL